MLEVQSIAKSFNAGTPNEVRSLRCVSLTLEPGSWVIIIGTNGSGKSTFLNAVAGAFFVDEGSIRIAGKDVTAWPEYARAEFVGRVFQNPLPGRTPRPDAWSRLGPEVLARGKNARRSQPA